MAAILERQQAKGAALAELGRRREHDADLKSLRHQLELEDKRDKARPMSQPYPKPYTTPSLEASPCIACVSCRLFAVPKVWRPGALLAVFQGCWCCSRQNIIGEFISVCTFDVGFEIKGHVPHCNKALHLQETSRTTIGPPQQSQHSHFTGPQPGSPDRRWPVCCAYRMQGIPLRISPSKKVPSPDATRLRFHSCHGRVLSCRHLRLPHNSTGTYSCSAVCCRSRPCGGGICISV